ncbi:ornithine--oxo-acid transaminase [Alkalibacter saccharofermentans]|uniref:ornithine aminotransferase n=1 Tax=Alkalibacter saccharofermentans DSM 14828 TaxID=1120975 RepID=A0A1M4S6V7_9FIRM|nr:ornithine--oxo-acid transaminase [Alkalibacter saccharofermentans]SHE27944.1 ornithine--oxo-acid transaminase [Alkalibacter saccharofermentans DSM 14828]
MQKIISETERYSARNYHPLPVVLAKGEGVWVWDKNGKKYLDMLAAYSAVNQGHRHPKIIQAAKDQMERITITSRAFHNDKMGEFLSLLCDVTGFDKALPMNTGAEAVETSIKAARKWGNKVKGVAENRAEIIVCDNNFHGRTVTIISFSSEEQYKTGFGPFTPGFISVEFGDAQKLEEAISENTVALLIEPVQGEGGVIVPPEGYMKKVREITERHRVLLIFDEIQTGLGRTGELFSYIHEKIRPDMLIVGKALGGGVYPVSAVLSSEEVMGVFKPGDHGSTFGGNPLASAVATASIKVILNEKLSEKSKENGRYFAQRLKEMESPMVKEIRSRGLMIGIEIKKSCGTARKYCELLLEEGILCKETHDQTLRFTPPLIIGKEEIDWAVGKIKDVLSR